MEYLSPAEDVNTDHFTDNNALEGSGGEPFTFIKLDERAALKKIQVWKIPRTIRGVEVWMTDGSSYLVGYREGVSKEFRFESGEPITRINIKTSLQERWNWKDWDLSMDHRLGAIVFETDRHRKWEISSSPEFLLKDGE
ncbi:hypothetical protein DPMN_135684 [Dreissena polymorpha]|uniref:Uncharacterized protein n=1 Tax=Dreissena polymorpha TaxID=45954 RepID=A0A9D4FZM1_DREPO|nr:hypothetical protein DPMN_135684 [Dreissena polymorpha]